MIKLSKNHLKKVISSALVCTMTATMLQCFPDNRFLVNAEETNQKYPYTMFAASSNEGAITVNANNFCVNGNVATNGTIVSIGNTNINGTRTEQAAEEMLYIFDKIDSKYFTGSNVEEYTEDYTLEEMNININKPVEVEGDATLTGNININSALKALENVELYGEVKNTNDSLIFSKYGDIIIESQNVNLNGLIYAPFGDVVVTAQNLNLNNVVIIADTITFDCPSVNANYSNSVAEFAGSVSDPLNIPYEEWQYMKDEDENEIPDFFEDYNNWKFLHDTDYDNLPDCIEHIFHTDILNPDTDGDMLPDGYEILTTLTNPAGYDSYYSSISDGDCDIDKDGLSNYQEYLIGTAPYNNDTDSDSLIDGAEVSEYYTNPLLFDTDDDGIGDADELYIGSNPLTASENENTLFTKHFTPDIFGIEYDEYYPEVTLTANATGITTFNIELRPMDMSINPNIPGYVGLAYDFSTEGEFHSANLEFHLPASLLENEDFEPTIYYYNTDEKRLEEVPNQTLSGNTVSANLEHFSSYLVINKRAFNAKYNDTAQLFKELPIEDDLYYENTADADIFIALDDSGSMEWNDPYFGRISATNQFVEQLPETDRVAVSKFTTYVTQLFKLDYMTNENHKKLADSLSILKSDGGTDCSAALHNAINNLDDDTRAKCIILLTDGVDDPGNSYDYDDIIESANEKGINIFTIGLGYNVNTELLNRIATETYGKYFSIYDTSELFDCFTEIKDLTIDYISDRNNDGISDYYTWKLCTGQMLDGTGQTVLPFGFPTEGNNFVEAAKNLYDKVQENDDFDHDGLKNGQEVSIHSYNNKKYAFVRSSVNSADTDFDDYSDYDERMIYHTDPLQRTVTLSDFQISHLTESNTFIASEYRDQVADGYLQKGLMWIGNTIYSRNAEEKIYAGEILEVLYAMDEVYSDPDWTDDASFLASGFASIASIGAAEFVEGLYKSSKYFDAGNYSKELTKYLQATKASEEMARCKYGEEAINLLDEWRTTNKYAELTQNIFLSSSIKNEWQVIQKNFNTNVIDKTSKFKYLNALYAGYIVVASLKTGSDTYKMYKDIYSLPERFEDTIEILETIKSNTDDSQLIEVINEILPGVRSAGVDQIDLASDAISEFGWDLLYNDVHFAIGIAGPVGATIEAVIGLGNLTGVSAASEAAVQVCCDTSIADALALNVESTARNNPTTHTNTASMSNLWYYEDGMESPYLSYDKMQAKYLYLLSARNFANERFLTLEKTGIISKWTNKEAINIAYTNQTWLSRNYLEELGLIFGHKNI